MIQFTFDKRRFAIAFPLLSILWIGLNYLLFTRKGMISHHPDMESMLEWTWNGLHGDYLRGFGNYMPIYPYFAFIYGLFFDNHDSLISNAYYLKSFNIMIEAFMYAVILSMVSFKRTAHFWVSLSLVVINIFLVYNSVFWGQIDCIHSLFILLSFYSLSNRNLNLFGIFITLAILTKIVSVIFLPVFGIWLINEVIIKKISIRQVFVGLGYAAATLVIAFLPIIFMGILPRYLNSMGEIISNYDCISGNAFNIYHLISNSEELISTSSDTILFKGLSYKMFGWLTFTFVTFLYFFPVIKIVYQNIVDKHLKSIPTNTLLLMCVLMPLVFFFFTVKMRERYAHPYVIFLTVYCLTNRRYLIWAMGSIIYFLQLETVLQYVKTLGVLGAKLHLETNFFAPPLIAGLFFSLICYLFYLHKLETTKTDGQVISEHHF